MLVLTRKNRESVVVGSPDDVECPVTITVLEIRGGQVKLSFQVASSVTVLRGELCEQQQAGGQPNRPKA